MPDVGVEVPIIDATVANNEIGYEAWHNDTMECDRPLIDGRALVGREVFHDNIDGNSKILPCFVLVSMICFRWVVDKVTTLRVERLDEVFLNKIVCTGVQKCRRGDGVSVAERN